jgi:serine/threonine protein kinase
MNLETYFNLMTNCISIKTICAIGIGLLNLMEGVHKAGYVYNNLKPESIMLCKTSENKFIFNDEGFAGLSQHLIDFGFATKYVDKDG